MQGVRNGVATQILDLQAKALYTHCYGHYLYLACQDTICRVKPFRDALDTTQELSQLLKYSHTIATVSVANAFWSSDPCPVRLCVWLTQPFGPDHGLRLLLSTLKGNVMFLYCCLTSALSAFLLPNLSIRLRSMVNPFERIVQRTALMNVASR